MKIIKLNHGSATVKADVDPKTVEALNRMSDLAFEKYSKQCNITHVGRRSEQVKPEPQICYKSDEPCKYDCPGLCRESC
jgi:hypothetical protein